MRQALVGQGYNLTGPRRRILDAFLRESKPVTASEIHRRISKQGIDLASVYRTIELFCRMGVLAEVDHIPEGRRYELSDEYRPHHHHLICRGCGKIQDFEDCFLEEFEKVVRRKAGFRVTRHDLKFFGLCRACA